MSDLYDKIKAKHVTEIDSDYLMPFGKYAGIALKSVPLDYLMWLRDRGWIEERYPALSTYLEDNDDMRDRIDDCEIMNEIGYLTDIYGD